MRKLESRRTTLFRELSEPCGAYTWKLPVAEQLYAGLMQRMGAFENPHVPLQNQVQIPQNWQRLAQHLHARGIARYPFLRTARQPDGQPLLVMIALDSERSESRFAYRAPATGFAHTFSVQESASKAIGETLERYFLAHPPERELVHGSYAELVRTDTRVLDPALLPSFLPWQKERFREFNWRADMPMYWVRGTDYGSGENILLPAQLIFWTYKNQPNEPMLLRATTSGCAGHFNRDDAILGALLEAIQREGFLIYWLNGIAPHVIDTSDLANRRTRDFVAALERTGLSPQFLDITTDLRVPACVCVLRETREQQVIAIGASAGFDEESTLLQSATEALAVFNSVSRRPAFPLPNPYEPFTSTRIRRDQRISAWRGSEMIERFSFFIAGEKRSLGEFLGDRRKKTAREDFAFVLGRLRDAGLGDPYIYEAHDSLLDELGYHVLRVVIPALMPLYLDEYAATLDCKRLRDVPVKLGYRAAREFTTWPHPFP